MELYEIFHAESIYTEEGKCLCNSWAAGLQGGTVGEGTPFPFHFIKERIGINQWYLTTLSTRLQQHGNTSFLSTFLNNSHQLLIIPYITRDCEKGS